MNRPIIQPHAPIFDLPPSVQTREYEIVDGKYDFAKNMLILEVEVKDTLTDGTVESRIERRGFEITSLKVRTRKAGEAPDPNAEPIELIGARTDAAMQRMLPSILANLNKNVDKTVFFSTAPTGGLTKKTIRLAQDFEQVTGTGTASHPAQFKVNDKAISSATDSEYFGDDANFEDRISNTLKVRGKPSTDTVQDKAALQTLLNYSNFESMIQDLEAHDADAAEHDVDMSETVINKHPRISEFARLIHTTSHLSSASHREAELIQFITQVTEIVKGLDLQLSLIDQFVQANQTILSPYAIVALKSQRRALEDDKLKFHARYSKAEKALSLLKDIKMLEAMYGHEALTLSLGGKAPMSAYLAKNLNLIMNQYGISFSQEADLEKQVKDRLGLEINFDVDTAFVSRRETAVKDVINEVAKVTVEVKIHELEDVLEKAESLISSAAGIESRAEDELRRLNQFAQTLNEKLERYRALVQEIDRGEEYDLAAELEDIKEFIAKTNAALILLESRLLGLKREKGGAPLRVTSRSPSATSRQSSFAASDAPSDDEDDRESFISARFNVETDEESVYTSAPESPERQPSSLFDFSDVDSDEAAAFFDDPRVSLESPRIKKSSDQRKLERRDFEAKRDRLQTSQRTAQEAHKNAQQAVKRMGGRTAQLLGLDDSSDSPSTDGEEA